LLSYFRVRSLGSGFSLSDIQIQILSRCVRCAGWFPTEYIEYCSEAIYTWFSPAVLFSVFLVVAALFLAIARSSALRLGFFCFGIFVDIVSFAAPKKKSTNFLMWAGGGAPLRLLPSVFFMWMCCCCQVVGSAFVVTVCGEKYS